jgi:hypothetical protein
MRELRSTDRNELIIFDKQSGTKIKFFWRTPSTSERVAYKSAIINAAQKHRMDPSGAISDVQLEFGLKFITGFDDNNFSVDDAAISTNPTSPVYYADWKAFLKETASDLVFAFVDIVFDAPNYQLKNDVFF